VRQERQHGSVRGVLGNRHPYRDRPSFRADRIWHCADESPRIHRKTRRAEAPTLRGADWQSARRSVTGALRFAESLQLGVLGPGLREDRDVAVGVLPEREEILVRGFRLCRLPRHRERFA
jgi:hypothetical protein